MLNERFISFLESKNLLSDSQNGFRRKNSTVRAIYQALTKILSSIDSGKKTVALYLDLSRAFDSVDHGALVLKL